MATERAPRPDAIPHPNELGPPITDADELPPITAEDIAHTVERLEAGRASGEYTNMRTSDLYVLGHLRQMGQGQIDAVLRDPLLLPHLVMPQPESESGMPTLRHGAIIARLGGYLDEHVRTSRLGLVCGPQTTFKVVGMPPMRYPDLAFVRRDRLPADLDADADFAPDLAAEIVSGSDTFGDVAAKLRQYFASGVELVWIIDPLLRTVSAHTPHGHPAIYTGTDDLIGDPVLPRFRVPMADLFDF